MYGFPSPMSGGAPDRPGGSPKSSTPGKAAYGGQSATGGSIAISAVEERALRVLELDPVDDQQTFMRASQESGLTPEAVQKLQQRADAARSKGYTLKGPSITLQPLSGGQGNGLLGDSGLAGLDGGDGTALDPTTQAGAAGPAGVTGAVGKPAGGPIAGGATMSSAGLSNSRMSPPWRPGMSQAIAEPPKVSPGVDAAAGNGPAPSARMATGGAPAGMPRQPQQATPGASRLQMGSTSRPAAGPAQGGGMSRAGGMTPGAPRTPQPLARPAARPGVPQRTAAPVTPARKPLSGMSGGIHRDGDRDEALSAAYARETNRAFAECGDDMDCGCGGKNKRRR